VNAEGPGAVGRVALLTREYPPDVYGGAGVHVEHLAPALADHAEVAVHCFGEPRGDPLVAGAYRPWDALSGQEPERAALRTLSVDLAMVAGVRGVDLVHSHTWYANLAGHWAKLVHEVPHVATTHSLEPLRPWKREQLGGGYALSSFAERTALEGADAVIAVSEQMRADVLASYPAVDPGRVVVIHNGIDPVVYAPDPHTGVLEERGIDPTRPSVVFVGRITRQKGLPLLLEAAHELHPDAQLVLCAGAPDTPEIAAEVEREVASLRNERTGVVWIDEMLPRAEVVQILSHATVFVCPSVYEPFGLVNLEAMACGAAVVATETGGIPEIVVEGETGHLVPYATAGKITVPGHEDDIGPSDRQRFVADLAERINGLVTDPQRAAGYGRAGRERVLEHFTWETVATRTVELYRRVLASG
jgi:alpha-maltose-1-phosphate synthase